MRNLTKTIALVSLLAPASGYPLGIGEIKLHSALNQNLDAEISLDVSAGEHIDDIKVKLASPDKFDEAGITWSFFLSKIKFEKVSKTNDVVNVKLTTDEVLKEPFLDFMIEVTWPKGTLYREFTVLLDPPATYQQAVAPVTVVTKTNAAIIKPPPKPAAPVSRAVAVQPADQTGAVVSQATSKNGDSLWKIAERVNSYSDVITEQMIVALYEANPRAFYKKNINALMSGKTLTVPEKEEILKLSRQQALAEYNKQNQAWRGRIQPVSPKQSRQPVTTADQDALDTQLKLVAPTEAEIAENVVVTAGEQDDSPGDANAQVSEQGVSVKSPSADASNTAELELRLQRLEQQLQAMQKMLALKDAEITALQNRKHTEVTEVAEPSQAAQQPAQPEQKAETAVPSGEPETPKPDSAPSQQASVDVQPEPKPVAVPDTTPAKPEVQPEQAPVSVETKDKVEPKAEPVVTAKETKPEVVKPAGTEVKPAGEVKKPKRVIPVEPFPDDGLDPELVTLAIAGGSALILAALGAVWWRKRKVSAQSTTESMFATTTEINLPSSADDDLVVPIIENAANFDIGTSGESSFIGDFSLATDFDSFEADQTEVDPVSEADVYLAYGRYLQAEELMRQAVIDQPDRDECKLKLLEILYANEDVEAFDEYANELAAQGKQSDTVFWDKLLEMRAEISPETELVVDESIVKIDTGAAEALEELEASFNESVAGNEAQVAPAAAAEAAAEEMGASEGDLGGLDFDFSLDDSIQDILTDSDEIDVFNIADTEADLALEQAETNKALEDAFDLDHDDGILDISSTEVSSLDEDRSVLSLDKEDDDLSLDFGLDDFSLDNETGEPELEAKAPDVDVEDNNLLEFDLDAFDSDAEKEGASSVESSVAEEIETIDFDLDFPEQSTAASIETIELVDDGLDFTADLDDLSLTTETAKASAPDDSIELTLDDEDELDDFSLDMDFLGDDDDQQDADFNVEDLTDMDELETKLDLAKAYIDMGDKEAAESLAQEALAKGNEKQKAVAQFILDGLG